MSVEEIKKLIEEIELHEHKEIIKYLRLVHFSTDLADECLQEAYVEALIHADKIRSPDSLKSWLITVATRKAQKAYYQYIRMIQACMRNPPVIDDVENSHLRRLVLIDAVAKILCEFPPHYAEIMRLRYDEGHSFQYIASKLNLQPACVRQADCRVRRHLAKEIGSIKKWMED